MYFERKCSMFDGFGEGYNDARTVEILNLCFAVAQPASYGVAAPILEERFMMLDAVARS
jgi:hypothetical protein